MADLRIRKGVPLQDARIWVISTADILVVKIIKFSIKSSYLAIRTSCNTDRHLYNQPIIAYHLL